MNFTEQEAKKNWCPLASALDEQNAGSDEPKASINRRQNGRPDPDCLCVASACMAWRWKAERDGKPKDGADRYGYCGAFGRPEFTR